MPLYIEPVIRAPNSHGKLRLVTVLGHLPGAVGRGFDGDGIPPKRKPFYNQLETGPNSQPIGSDRRRIWWFEEPLELPWPPGVALLPQAAYDAIDLVREATKPLPPPTVPQRITITGGLVRATYFEQLNSGTAGTVTAPNNARIILDQWDDEIDAVVSADLNGIPTFESPKATNNAVVTATLDTSGIWSLNLRPTRYPIHLIYVAETEIGNYIDDSKLIPE